jgi:hypothetical protein
LGKSQLTAAFHQPPQCQQITRGQD